MAQHKASSIAASKQSEEPASPISRMRSLIGRRGLFWIGGGLAAIIVVAFIVLLFQPSGKSGSPGILSVGQAAPDFTLADVSGHKISLAAERGHPVILNFWATYCQPCQSETPLLQRTMVQYSSSGLVVLGIDQADPVVDVAQFGKDYGLTYPLLPDVSQSVNHLYGVTGLPVSYFVDKSGVIRYDVNGALQPQTLAAGLRSIGLG
jgi:cytochrome c biogenesis protein CcmG/thiol:disulfide interchange protein DsbE